MTRAAISKHAIALLSLAVPALCWAAPPFGRAETPREPAAARGERVRVYELYARVTSYHNVPGDPLNGGPFNFMGRRLVAGRSAAGPSSLAGALVHVPDFQPGTPSMRVSPELRRLITRKKYDGFFVIDDIGSAITFLRGGRPARWMERVPLAELSRYSLARREAVLDLDIMIPDAMLAETYENPLCLVRVYQADLEGLHWIASPSPVWKGQKPYFDTILRHGAFMELLDGEPVIANADP